jgi:alcohol dehydrogenase class IV
MKSKLWWPDTARGAEFLSPSLVVSGRGSTANVAEILKRRFDLEKGTILVAVDDIVLSAGLAAPLLDALDSAGYTTVLSQGYGSEPTDLVIDAAAEKARAAGAELVIGIGGGSVLDSSKILALLLRNGGCSSDWLGAVEPPSVAPLLLVPTTCGTGAEATRIAMVTVDGAKRASSCALYVPSVVVIDPDLVASLPPFVIAATAMDALSHAVESLMSTTCSPLTAHHALTAIQLLIENIEDAVGGDQDALARCLWGSHLAGQALNAGVLVGHSLAYCIAWAKPMPHGVSCALALPYCLAYNRNLDSQLAQTLASTLTGGDSSDLKNAAVAVMALAHRLGLPTTLDEAQVPADTEAEMAARCVAEYPRPTNPEPLAESALDELLVAMRTGNLDAAFAVHLADATTL